MAETVLPIGGTTGLCHSSAGEVEVAAEWLSRQVRGPAAVVPVLKECFGLSAVEACEAIALARGLAARRAPNEA